MPLLLKNAHFFDFRNNTSTHTNLLVFEDSVAVNAKGVAKEIKGRIELIKDVNEISGKYEDLEIINCYGKIVMHSFVNAHQHGYLGLTRIRNNSEDFEHRIKSGDWKIDKAMNKEILYAAALYTAMDAIKNGTTFVIEHHSSRSFIQDSLETIKAAYSRVGLEFLPCFEISDRKGYASPSETLDYTDSWLSNNEGLVGLHASFTVGDETMTKAVNLANKHNTGIHIHAAESTLDQDACMKEHGKTVIQRLYVSGVLDSKKTILAHAIHLSDEEAELINNQGVYVAQNMESNLRSNVGYFNSDGVGDNIMLGTDGLHGNMMRGAKTAFIAGQGFDNITPKIAIQRLRKGNEYLIKNKFNCSVENSLLVFDYPYTETVTNENIANHMIFGMESKHISHVISNGKVIATKGKLTMADEDEIMAEVRLRTDELIKSI